MLAIWFDVSSQDKVEVSVRTEVNLLYKVYKFTILCTSKSLVHVV